MAQVGKSQEFISIKRILRERLYPIRAFDESFNVDTAYEELDLCYTFLKEKEYDKALEETEKFIRKYDSSHPLSSDALYLKAEILFTKNENVTNDEIDKIYDVIDAFKIAIDHSPNSISAEDAYLEIAKLYQFLELPTDAAKTYDEMLRKYPNTSKKKEIYFKLGDIYFNRKEYEKCIDIFYPTAEKERGTKQGIQAAFYLGNCYYMMKNYTRAAKFFLQGSREDFSLILKKPKLRFNMGKTMFRVKNFKKAIQVFTNLHIDYPKFEETDIIFLRVGDCYNEQKKYLEALKYYVIAAYKFSSLKGGVTSKMRLAGLKEKDGSMELDSFFWDKLIARSKKKKKEKAKKGKSHLVAGLVAQREDNEYLDEDFISAMVYYNDPETTYKDLIDEYGGSPLEEAALSGLAIFYFNRRKYTQAIKYFTQLRELFPQGVYAENSTKFFDEAVYKLIGEYYNKDKNHDAIKIFSKNKKFLSKKFPFHEMYFFLGMSYYKLHLHKEAKTHLLFYLNKSGNSEKIKTAKKSMVDIFFKIKQPQKAVILLSAIARTKNNPRFSRWAKKILANYYFEKKEYNKAANLFSSIYKKLKKPQQTDLQNLFRYATALEKSRKSRKSRKAKKRKEAKAVLKMVVSAEKQDSQLSKSRWFMAILVKYARILYREKLFLKASEIFHKASELAQNGTEKMSNLYQKALCYFGLKRYSDGKNILQIISENSQSTFWKKQAVFKLKDVSIQGKGV